MKMLAEYLEKAINFERMATEETDAKLRAEFQKQATAYRKLAGERAKQLQSPGMPSPSRRDEP